MSPIRLRNLLLSGVLALAVTPALAEDSPKDSGNGALGLLEDVVDGVGGILKILVGPPISSPSPYLNLPGNYEQSEDKPKQAPVPVAVPSPPLPPASPTPATVAPPVAGPPAAVVVTPPPALKAVTPQPRPQQPAVITKPAATPLPPMEPICQTRAAATATLEQAAKLPPCK